MSGSRFHPYSASEANKIPLGSNNQKRASRTASTSHQATSYGISPEENPFPISSTNRNDELTATNLKASTRPPWPFAPRQATSTPLSGEAAAFQSIQSWSMEQQQLVQMQQQQVWMQQPPLVYMAGGPQEYIRHMNELRQMSLLPLLPISPPMQDHPLNLSLKDRFQDSTQGSSELSSIHSRGSSDSVSFEKPRSCDQPSHEKSPTLTVKLHPTKPIEMGSLDPDVAKMFPHLRSTDLGSIVLWNFLWALLADKNYKGIINWIDRPARKFRVLHPEALASMWGTVKKSTSMNWGKLMKVINLYMSKNILKQGEDKLVFQFVLIPQSAEIKEQN